MKNSLNEKEIAIILLLNSSILSLHGTVLCIKRVKLMCDVNYVMMDELCCYGWLR